MKEGERTSLPSMPMSKVRGVSGFLESIVKKRY